MKIDKVPGEFAFKALYNTTPESIVPHWKLSEEVFFTKEEVDAIFVQAKWPVEVYEDGTVYVPAEEEL